MLADPAGGFVEIELRVTGDFGLFGKMRLDFRERILGVPACGLHEVCRKPLFIVKQHAQQMFRQQALMVAVACEILGGDKKALDSFGVSFHIHICYMVLQRHFRKRLEMQITALQTYPVKGMSASKHARTRLEASGGMPGDRIYAVQHEMSASADAPPSPNVTLSHLTLSRNPKIGELQSRFDDSNHLLQLYRQGEEVASGHLNNDSDRKGIESFLVGHMGETIRGNLRIVERNAERDGADFSYMGHAQFLSLINLASIAALEKIVGARIDPSRFRANIYFQGKTPWEEFEWVGRNIRLGGEACVEVREPIERCAAVNIDPDTGAKDMSLVRALFENFGHRDLGVYVRATESGDIAVEDAMEVLPQA